jgi:ProP effector
MSNQFLARANAGIAVLAERFPAVFASEYWQPHKPLKIGISKDIAAAGIMPAEDIGPTLRLYVHRLMYQRALAAGGARYDLNDELSGEVAAEHVTAAAAAVAAIEAKTQTAAATIIAAKKANRQPRVWKVFPESHDANKPDNRSKTGDFTAAPPLAPELPPAPTIPTEPAVKRLGLADLKKAAQERRAAANRAPA